MAHPDEAVMTDQAYSGSLETTYTHNLNELVFPGIFEFHASQRPEAPAIIAGPEEISYHQLNQQSNRLAHHLRALGVGIDVVVAVYMDRSLEMIVAALAIWKAGGAYLPIDPQYPTQRTIAILESSRASVLITTCLNQGQIPYDIQCYTLNLDEEADSISRMPSDNLFIQCRANQAMYVIYTSGSSGRPKGVIVSHQGMPYLVKTHISHLKVSPESRILQFAAFSFDAAIWEMTMALATGATLILAPEKSRIGPFLVDFISRQRITHATLPPAVLATMQGPGGLCLEILVAAGEKCSAKVAAGWCGGRRMMNAYGPTEATVCATISGPLNFQEEPPIGFPVPGTTVYVLDEKLRPVRNGTSGELYIAGPGLARGYMGLAAETAERFVADPFGPTGTRMYRTGDIVQARPDGALVFIGRADDQIKLRGLRIELGEIESVLRSHEDVQDALVSFRQEQDLVAYVVLSPEFSAQDEELSALEHWREASRKVYQQSSYPAEKKFGGWISSYTGEPIAEEEMEIWLEQLLLRLERLSPSRVLDLGCGSGLALFRLAPKCARYVGVDFSLEAISALQNQLCKREDLKHVVLQPGMVHDLSFLEDNTFDLVILNSVVQYLPSTDHLLKVLSEAVRVACPEGHIYVGDVRSLPLLNAYHLSVQLSKPANQLTLKQLIDAANEASQNEEELVIDPALFESIGKCWEKVGRVQIEPKAGRYNNELSRFRYDVTLSIGKKEKVASPQYWVAWSPEGKWRGELELALVEHRGSGVGLREVPDKRTAAILQTAQWANSSLTLEEVGIKCEDAPGEDPNELIELARQWGVAIHWQGFSDRGPRNVIFAPVWEPQELCPDFSDDFYQQLTNCPQFTQHRAKMSQKLHKYLSGRLPTYMIPSAIVVLPEWPLTTHGKIDRAALPGVRNELQTPRFAQTENEEILCLVFAEALGLEQVGIDDEFFSLGGDSISAMQVMNKVQVLFGWDLPLRALFSASTVAGLAAQIKKLESLRQPLARQSGAAPVPLSGGQIRLWFLDQLQGGSTEYNIPEAFRLRGELDVGSFQRALHAIVARHEILRTHFEEIDGQLIQVTEPEGRIDFCTECFEGWEEAERLQKIAEMEGLEWDRNFDLRRGPLLRMSLVRFASDDHFFIRTFHHAIYDGWSRDRFDRELMTLYAAFRSGREDPLSPLPVQYSDFAVWQRKTLSSENILPHIAYWKERLAGIPDELDLAKDHSREDIQNFDSEIHRTSLSADVVTRLKKAARENRATLFMVLLSCFGLLLQRYSGESDIVIGSPIANRPDEKLEPLIGFFVNILVMRIRLKIQGTFQELLNEVRTVALQAYQHQDAPFERLVEELCPSRSLNRAPVFQVTFGLQQAFPELRLPGLEAEPLLIRKCKGPFALDIRAFHEDGAIALSWIYNRHLFNRCRIEQMARHYERLISAIVASTEAPLHRIEMLLEEERNQLMVTANRTGVRYPKLCVHTFFEEQCRKTPQAIAVSFEGERRTYEEFDRQANQLAVFLQSLGAGPEILVATCLDRCIYAPLAFLAILKSGAVYVPLDPNYPEERLRFMLLDGRVSLVLTQEQFRERLSQLPAKIICLDSDWPMIEQQNPAQLQRNVVPENLAYVIYTSGSTGRPKGVMVPHGGLANELLWVLRDLLPQSSDRLLEKAAFTFDASIWETFCPWIYGEGMVLAQSSLDVLKTIQQEQITHVQFTSSALKSALEDEEFPRCLSLREVFCGGEMIPPELVPAFFARSHAGLRNLYGPTEITIIATHHLLTRENSELPCVPIGLPIANTQVYVLDPHLNLSPPGVIGELYVAGDGVTRGYLARPGLTATSFVANLYGDPGTRMYRTGDLARWNFDGLLECVGRADGQVKVRGFRIELEEIAHVLQDAPQVLDAAVIAKSHQGLNRLVAFVVLRKNSQDGQPGDLNKQGGENPKMSIGRLKSHLRKCLPEYMVPAVIVLVDALPLSTHGKLDRAALAALPESPEDAAIPDGIPRSLLEQEIARVWRQILERGQIGIFDNFFDVGGHSLLLPRMQRELQKITSVPLLLTDFFKYPTIASLADYLAEAGKERNMPGLSVEQLEKLQKGRGRLRAQRQSRQFTVTTTE
jgi:amino acid adenylation domain-containing protein